VDNRYKVRVKLAVEFDVATTAPDPRYAAHRAVEQVLYAMEGKADPPTLVGHEILSTHTTTLYRMQPAGKGQGE
jgi:hypothetical protein